MGFVMGKAKGQVDGTVVQQKVLERLNESRRTRRLGSSGPGVGLGVGLGEGCPVSLEPTVIVTVLPCRSLVPPVGC